MIPQIPAYVYMYLDNDGNVLYVGSTFDIHKRDIEHKSTDKWYSEVKQIMLFETNTRTDALAYESHYIALMKPKHNRIQKNYGCLSFLRNEPEWLTMEEYEERLKVKVANEIKKSEDVLNREGVLF